MKVLECSSRGDRRFSAFYAKVSVYGKLDSIENHYQMVKRKGNGLKCRKGERVEYIELGGKKLPPKYLTPFYKMLWVKYLDSNPELVEYASDFDKFNDMFRGKSINCQADVIRDYVKYGRDYVMSDCKELIEILERE